MKKIINIVAVILIVILAALLISGKSQNNQTNNNQPQQENVGRGFEDPKELANKYIEAILNGNAEDLIAYMPEDVIKTIAYQNDTNTDVVKYDLIRWYQEETDYYIEWLEDNYGYGVSASGVNWTVEDLEYGWYGIEELDGETFGVAGYEYYGLRGNGIESYRSYRAEIECETYATFETYYLYFAFVEIDGLWYLMGVD